MSYYLSNIFLSIRPLAGPVGIFHRYRPVIIGIVWLIGFIVLIFILLAMRKASKNKPKPVVPVADLALDKISRLGADYDKKTINDKDLYIKLVDALREYIEKRFDVRLSRMTTEQFLNCIENIRDISKKNKDSIAQLLNKKDNINFAAKGVSEDELKAMVQFVVGFINNTK